MKAHRARVGNGGGVFADLEIYDLIVEIAVTGCGVGFLGVVWGSARSDRSAFGEHVFEGFEEIKWTKVAADAAEFAITVHQDHGRDHLDWTF